MIDRETALKLLKQYTKNEGLLKHAFAIETVMRALARRFDADEDRWALTGLLHDFDYEQFPDTHPAEGVKLLRELGYPDDVVYAVESHAERQGLQRRRLLDKALFAADELTGFIIACSLVQPGKSVKEVSVDSVKRKLKDKAFAKKVSRDDINKGVEELGIPLDELIAFIIKALSEAEGAK